MKLLIISSVVTIAVLLTELSSLVSSSEKSRGCKKYSSAEGECIDKSLLQSLHANRTMPYIRQDVKHCDMSSKKSRHCREHWYDSYGRYLWSLKAHYNALKVQSNHSLNRVDRATPFVAQVSKALKVDLMVDARCHHSWPYNPYHRFADCLVFMLPALNNYFQDHLATRNPPLRDTNVKIALIVDEATEILCETYNRKTDFEGKRVNVSTDDACFMADFQWKLRTRYFYQCIKISIFKKSIYWHKLQRYVSVMAKEMVWLGEQNNPFTFGSGFMNERDPQYTEYIKSFRELMFRAFCRHCRVSSTSEVYGTLVDVRKQGLSFENPQDNIVVIRRKADTGRYILQQDALESKLQRVLKEVQSSTKRAYRLVFFTGEESLCTTIAMFWSAKVVVAAHGAGIVNAVFARPNTLLVEITPDKVEPELRGQPWRLNSPFAQAVGLSTHVLVVPHNASGTNDGDIQKVCAMSLTDEHIQKAGQVVREYLLREKYTGELAFYNRVQTINITTMV